VPSSAPTFDNSARASSFLLDRHAWGRSKPLVPRVSGQLLRNAALERCIAHRAGWV
jgi:hypothetical protein